jgi:DNA-binding transcriptional LysR family regulator
MSLSSLYLDAFIAVAHAKGFSAAARQLNITQSALSQRIKNLEDDLGLTLFIRTPTGAVATEAGERLLRYCQVRDSLEGQLVHDMNVSKDFQITGTIKVASYSSVLRSVLIPALKPLLEEHPNLLCEFTCAKMHELPGLLQRGSVDFIVMDYRWDRSNVQATLLGEEKYVLIEGKQVSDRADIMLDNDQDDRSTEMFFKAQSGKTPKYRRSYFDDCYGIIDGVLEGLGRAVMSEHLVQRKKGVRILRTNKPFKVDVVLHHYHQPIYSKLHESVVQHLIDRAKLFL